MSFQSLIVYSLLLLVAVDANRELTAQLLMFGGGNPKATPDGLTLVEGDMATQTNATGSDAEGSHVDQYKATSRVTNLWRHGIIPYTFHSCKFWSISINSTSITL